MPYTVYILYSEKDKGVYVGCTQNILKRLKLHEQGFVFSTKNRRPLILIFQQFFLQKSDAFQRERFFKSLWGAREKKKILDNYLNSVRHG